MRIPTLEEIQQYFRVYSLIKQWPDIAEIADAMGEDFFDWYSDREWHTSNSPRSPVMRAWQGRARCWVRRYRERHPVTLRATTIPNYKEKLLQQYQETKGTR